MTKEEAIAIIKDHMFVHKIYEERAVKITEALNMAISALEQPEIIRCKDCRYGVDHYHDGDCYCSKPKFGLIYFGGSWDFYCAGAERRFE